MVQNTVRLILCLLAGHVFMVSASYNECEPKEYARCNRLFSDVFETAEENENVLDTYCSAYKVKVQCLASNFECAGKTIDFIRFAVLQHAIIDITLGTCPSMDLKPLREVAQGYEKYQMKIDGLKDLEADDFQPCAAKKNLYCASQMAEKMKDDVNLSKALPNFFKCYDSKAMVCDVVIYKDYVLSIKRSTAVVKELVKTFPKVLACC